MMQRPDQVELSVLVPCFNEEGNLPELVERLGRTLDRGQIAGQVILVDDGSRDRTWQVIQDLAVSNPFVVPICHEGNRGLAAAWRTALELAQGSLVCLIDADLQYQPEDILRLRRMLHETQCDIVQGWRSPVGRERQPRYYWSRGLNWILNRLFGMRLRDNKSGFVLCPREVLADLLSYRGRYNFWQSFLMIAAHTKGYSYREVETLFEERRAGESFLADVPLRVILKVLRDLGPAVMEYRIRPPRRDITETVLRSAAIKASSNGHGPSPAPPAPGPAAPEGKGGRWWLYRQTFVQTHWMMTKEAFKHLDELQRSQWLAPEAVRELQDFKLRRLVRHAYRHVPFYRQRMRENGVTPDDIRGVEDLPKLPFLTKQDVRDNLHFDIMSDNHEKAEILKITTSGSTGEPFVCYVDRSQLEFRWAATMRAMMWTGWRPGEPQVRLWHQTIGMSRSQVLREHADAWLLRRSFIPAYEISESNIRKVLDTIQRVRPALLDGYAESFNLLGRYLRERGPLDVAPKGMMSSAQALPELSRRIIEESFGCRVFDKYGSREFSGIAYECDAHAGHHVVAEGYAVEVLNGGRPCRPGEIGEVVITDLNNFCLPFIRYRIGDLAEAVDGSVPCACGRGLPLLGAIQGRVQSVIIGADGQYVPGTFFAHVFKDFDHAVRQYQVVQARPGAITLRIVRGGRYTDRTMQEILALLKKFLGARTVIDVEIAENIQMVRTGKRLQAVSSVAIDLQSEEVPIQVGEPR